MTLSPWQKDILKEGELYVVGGVVRDQLMGQGGPVGEVDFLVRGITPDRLEEMLSPYGRIQLVGKSFGVYKFHPAGKKDRIDIAFPRREVSTGPGHRDFEVAFDPELPLEDDLGRRDFTMNAMAKNLRDGTVIDPHHGQRDIKKRMVRMIFPRAFEEDALRILRGIRFAARFGFDIEKKTLAAMSDNAGLLETLSAERVQEELNRLLAECERPSVGFVHMHKIGVLEVVLPELERCYGVEQNEYHPDDIFWHSVKSCDQAPRDNMLVRWAALLHDLGKVDKKQVITEEGAAPRVVFYGHEEVSAELTERILKRLRFGREFTYKCVHLVAQHMFYYQSEWNRSTVRRFIRSAGRDNLGDLFALRKADLLSRGLTSDLRGLAELRRRVESELEAEHALKIEDLAIDGNDVIRVLGLGEGKEVGRILEALFERVLESPALNQRAALLDLLEREFGGK